MYNHLLYFSYWIVNSFVISFFHYLYPNDFVLGTVKFTPLDASIYSGFWLTFVVWTFWDYIMAKEIKFGGIKTGLWFWMANVIGIWVTARLSNFTGFGISYFYLAIILGFFTNLLQRLIRKFVTKNI
jgi:hypothetical protein